MARGRALMKMITVVVFFWFFFLAVIGDAAGKCCYASGFRRFLGPANKALGGKGKE
jgi:hypothetical protein